MTATSRTDLLRRQGFIESGMAVVTAVMLVAGGSGGALAPLVGAMAIWMAFRGRKLLEESVPLTDPERRELDRIKAGSRHVREMLALVERIGQTPVRFDLGRARRLARLEALTDGRA